MLAERDGDVLGGADRDHARQRHPAARELAEADRESAHHDDPQHLRAASLEERLDRHLQVRTVPQLEQASDDRQPARILAEVLTQAPSCLVLGRWGVALRPGVELLDRAGKLLRLHAVHACSRG